jgi:hypothetical protein
MLISIRPRKHFLVLYSFLFANLALPSACGGSQQGAPIIAGTMPSTGIVNSAYSFIFAVSSGGQAPFSWSETGALPAGLTLASNGKPIPVPAPSLQPQTLSLTRASPIPQLCSMMATSCLRAARVSRVLLLHPQRFTIPLLGLSRARPER